MSKIFVKPVISVVSTSTSNTDPVVNAERFMSITGLVVIFVPVTVNAVTFESGVIVVAPVAATSKSVKLIAEASPPFNNVVVPAVVLPIVIASACVPSVAILIVETLFDVTPPISIVPSVVVSAIFNAVAALAKLIVVEVTFRRFVVAAEVISPPETVRSPDNVMLPVTFTSVAEAASVIRLICVTSAEPIVTSAAPPASRVIAAVASLSTAVNVIAPASSRLNVMVPSTASPISIAFPFAPVMSPPKTVASRAKYTSSSA